MAIKAPILGSANNIQKLEQVLQAFFTELEAAINRVGPGTIVAYGGDVVPEGWLLCDGSTYNISKYPDLASILKDLWGATSDTFDVPNLVGQFLYGDDGSGVGTAGPTVGTGAATSSRIMWIIKV